MCLEPFFAENHRYFSTFSYFLCSYTMIYLYHLTGCKWFKEDNMLFAEVQHMA